MATGALLAAAGCTSTSGPPGGFGVNVTVDASAIATAERASVANGVLHVDRAETKIKSFDVHGAFPSGEVRFRYVPTVTTGTLKLTFDALDAAGGIVATGSIDDVVLIADKAVAAKITLAKGSGKKSNGTVCGAASDCDTGFCVDGVCCAEACGGACASCSLEGNKGACVPYPADTDPELECGAKLPPTGTADGGSPDGSASDGGDGGAPDGADGGAPDGLVINGPDGGIMTTPGACAGTCSGARSCKFPGTDKSCGKPFCNTSEDIASFVCDGNGGCSVGVSHCSDYACDPTPATCRTTCSQPEHCNQGDYCNANGQCTSKKGISIACTLSTECQSGFCASGVCCETSCDQPGFTCNDSGSVGKCKCPGLTCSEGCRIFYADADGDSFGDRLGSISGATARPGCVEAPPAGFVANNTDCDDHDSSVHPDVPGQTKLGFSGSPSLGPNHTFDRNCDGTIEKQTPEYRSGTCKFCGAVGTCDQTTSFCYTAGAHASFQCPQEILLFTALATPAASIPIFFPQCCGCYTADQVGFTTTVACGALASVTNCGTCSIAGGPTMSSSATLQQQCR
jgi:hypothetical protein